MPQRAPDPVRHLALTASLGALVLFTMAATRGAAEDARATADRPERGISVFTEYSRLLIPVGESVRIDLTVAGTLVCFAVCYACFVRQEVRTS